MPGPAPRRDEAETLFEDAEIVVRARPGAGDAPRPVLVTFGDYVRRPEQPGFWAEAPAARMGWPALGFVARRANWYPAASMAAAAAAVRGRIGPVSVGYGYSMGGYAALKYGRLLGLSHALTLSPQVSIAPADLPEDPRYHVNHEPALHAAMRVRPEELPPHAWMLLDPQHGGDALNAALLEAPGLRKVPVRGLYHATIRLAADGPALEAMLAAVLADDAGAMRRVLRARRRALPSWYGGMGAALIGRGHAGAGDALIRRGRARGLLPDDEMEALGEALAANLLDRRPGAEARREALVRRLREVPGLSAGSHLDRSLRLSAAGMAEASRQAAEQGLEAEGPHAGLLAHLGHLLLGAGRHAEALAMLEEALRLDPAQDWALVGAARARLRLDDRAGAEAAAREAARLQPGQTHPLFALGEVLTARGRHAEAAAVFGRAAALGGGEAAEEARSRAEARIGGWVRRLIRRLRSG